MIGAVDRVFNIEDRRDHPAQRLAILDGHRSVGALGHHLQGRAVLTGQAHTHQPEAFGIEHRLDQHGDTGIDPGLGDQARFVFGYGREFAFVRRQFRLEYKKERVRRAHLLLAMFNALQPGVFALSGWDLVGALPIPAGKRFDQLTVLPIAPLLARAIKAVFDDGSVASLFDTVGVAGA